MRRSDLALVAAVALAFSPAMIAMARVWSQHEYLSHGFLVPVIAAAMFASKRRALGPLRREGRGCCFSASPRCCWQQGSSQAVPPGWASRSSPR